MTADTRPVAQEAADRLREIVKPGDTLYTVLRGTTRSGVRKVRFYTSAHERITSLVAEVLDLHVIPQTGCVKLYGLPVSGLSIVADRLSVALFGEPGLIKGEYL